MSHTNKTTNYGLPQFVGTDIPTWLGDVNTGYLAIDAQMKTNADGITTLTNSLSDVNSSITSINSTLTSQQSSINTLNSNVTSNTNSINTLNNSFTAGSTQSYTMSFLSSYVSTASLDYNSFNIIPVTIGSLNFVSFFGTFNITIPSGINVNNAVPAGYFLYSSDTNLYNALTLNGTRVLEYSMAGVGMLSSSVYSVSSAAILKANSDTVSIGLHGNAIDYTLTSAASLFLRLNGWIVLN